MHISSFGISAEITDYNEDPLLHEVITKNMIHGPCGILNFEQNTILKGKYKGEDVLIPRISMIPNDMPFSFKRLQFPVRLANASRTGNCKRCNK